MFFRLSVVTVRWWVLNTGTLTTRSLSWADRAIRTPQTLEIKTKVGGEMLQVRVRDGDRVRKGQLLAKIDGADIVSGYRADRQDPLVGKFNALGWNTLVTILFGRLCRDIDCGFKLFRREVLDHVNIVSDGAMIDTEFLAGAKARGFRITDVPVTHLPRTAGEATGANVAVIVKAFRDLAGFRLRLSRELREERKSK